MALGQTINVNVESSRDWIKFVFTKLWLLPAVSDAK